MEIPQGPRYATKMKMRNLRAKVKLLLPNNVCSHYKDRNAKMEKFQPKRQKSQKNIRNVALKDQWCCASKQLDPWYYETSEPLNMFAEFYKLTKEELQEISDNKHYFLPEKYVEPFTKYLAEQQQPLIEMKSVTLKPSTPSTKRHRKHYKSQTLVNQIPIIPNLIRASQHVQKQQEKQRQTHQRYQILQQIRRNKSLQREGFIEAKLMKAMNTRYEINQLKQDSNRRNVDNRVKNVKNTEELRMLRSERTEIVRMTSELKKICTFRKRQKVKEFFVSENE